MPPASVDALIETATDGISFDGLSVDFDGSYTFETPAVSETGLSESALRDCATGSPYVENWHFWHAIAPQSEDRWVFLRWIEGADDGSSVESRYDKLQDGLTTTWGELSITVSLAENGERRYSLCHTDDAGTVRADPDVAESLEQYRDPLRARELATYDSDGRYRPLKTAPSLAPGWEFPDLSATNLVKTVDFFYPATVANWHRERTDELDITHWHETMARQTGIYQIVSTWDRGEGHNHVEWVAESCCTDSQCLKRREWQYDAETPLETPAGDGEFPCREPCSLVISAARKFTKLDAEEVQSYEFKLTSSEKSQLEGLIDAVAEGRISDIREADISKPANRYRTRFLRARRFDDDGRLCGVPTGEN